MQADTPVPALEPSASLYARQAVDDFLTAATAERERLELTIAEAKARTDRARAVIGMHRVMVSMLLETQHELDALREAADREAQAIVSNAEEEARAIVQAARDEFERRQLEQAVATAPSSEPTPTIAPATDASTEWPPPPASAEPLIDLTRADNHEREEARWMPPSNSVMTTTFVRNGMSDARDDDQYFNYLRAALADDRPLGPRLD